MEEKEVREEAPEEEVLMENVTPEDLPREGEETPFVPSPRWKRIFAWVLFAVVLIGIVLWLLNIAYPDWIPALRARLFSGT